MRLVYSVRNTDSLDLLKEIFGKAVENIRKFYRYVDGIWVPLSYRAFGFPCKIDGGPSRDEKTDLTWMTEDVALITNFLNDRRASPGISRKHLSAENQQLQLENNHFPASVVFDTYTEIKELLEPPSRFSSNPAALMTTIPNQYKFRCSSVLNDTSFPFNGNGIMFVYLTGHGLSTELAKEWSNVEVCLKSKLSDFSKYPVTEPDCGRLNADEELQGGDIIAYIKFVSIQDFIKEFIEVCRQNTCEFGQLGIFEREPLFKHRHLIILVDACFAGHWITSLEEELSLAFVENTNISITIQTSTDSDTHSYGYFFTPLFVKLQNLDQIELDQCVQEFMNRDYKQGFLKQIEQLPKFSYFKTDLNKTDGKLYLKNHENDWKQSLYFTVHNLRFFVNEQFFAYFAHRYKYELLETDENMVPRPVLDNSEGPQFLRMLTTKKMAIRGMKLTRYNRDKTPLCIIAIRSKTDRFISTRNVLSHNDEYWYHLHVHYDGEDKYPGSITHLKLVYALQDQLRYYEKRIYVDASIDDKDDYNSTSKQNVDEHIGNWEQYHQNLEDYLTNWVKSQNDGLKIWENKDKWNKIDPARLGNVAVRNRSRYLITKGIDMNQFENKIDEENIGSISDKSEELASNDSTESTSNESEESASNHPRA